MNIVKANVQLLTPLTEDLLHLVEVAGRICYRSDTTGNTEQFIRKRIQEGHESILEHACVSVLITCDRGVSHEIVRHRIASYSQESTRYCNYSKEKFGKEITVVLPCFWDVYGADATKYIYWQTAMRADEQAYFQLLDAGCTPQEARSVLPNSLATQIVVTYNLREWRHFLKLRCAPAAHPQMREIAFKILELFRRGLPVIVEDIKYIGG